MGKTPTPKPTVKQGMAFEGPPCGYCGAKTRFVAKQKWRCEKAHWLVRKRG